LATYRSGVNYKALALGKIPNWGWHLKDFKSECLSEVADTFTWNLMRTSTFALLPAWIAYEAVREQLWIDHATVKNGDSITSDLAEYAKTPLSENVEAEFARLAKAYRSTDEEMVKALLEAIGMEFVGNSIPTSRGTAVGVEIVFESVVRESWTAFEDLVRELWAVVLDNDDGSISNRVIGTIRKPSKNVTPTFNIRTHPGSFQVETRQVVFQTFRDIKKFYGAAFGPTAINLFDTVEAGYIHVLYAFRNVLVHKRGKSDATFREQIANYPEFNRIKEGEQIALDGEAARKMRDAAMILGRKLVELADTELQRQQKP
jgi:hypothetical protein